MPYPLTLPAGGKDLGAGFLAGGVSPQEHGIGGKPPARAAFST